MSLCALVKIGAPLRAGLIWNVQPDFRVRRYWQVWNQESHAELLGLVIQMVQIR